MYDEIMGEILKEVAVMCGMTTSVWEMSKVHFPLVFPF